MVTIGYVAMVVVGGLGSVLGAFLGAFVITLLPHGIDMVVGIISLPAVFEKYIFAIQYGSYGVLLILFLLFEPLGLVEIWRRTRNYFELWPFKVRAMVITRR